MNNKSNTNLPKSVKEFFTYLDIIKGKSQNTIDGYSTDLSLYFKYMKQQKCDLGNVEFKDIDISDVDVTFIKTIKLTDIHAFMGFLTTERKNGKCARSRKTSSLKSFYTYLEKINEAITANENITLRLELPELEKRKPTVLTMEEVKKVIDAIEDGYCNSKRDMAIISLLLNDGLRREEISVLNLDSIQGNMLQVIGKGNKERFLKINSFCMKSINDWLEERKERELKIGHEDALFINRLGVRLSKKSVGDLVKKYVVKAGLNPNKFSTHKFRSTCATTMHKQGIDTLTISKILGHSNISTTQIYIDVDSEETSKAIDNSPFNFNIAKMHEEIEQRDESEVSL